MARIRVVRPRPLIGTLGIDFGTTSCRVTFVDQNDETYQVDDPNYVYWTAYAQSKHGANEMPTVGAILPDGTFIVGEKAYAERDVGSSYFVQLKPSLYIVTGVELGNLSKYEPLRALLTHLGENDLRPRLRDLLVHFFGWIKQLVERQAEKIGMEYHTIAVTIPNCWAEEPLTAMQSEYESIIGEVWQDKSIEVLFEVEALAHQLIQKHSEDLQAFDRVIFNDNGGHTISVQTFEPFWPQDGNSELVPTFMSVSEGCSELGGGECWEHLLVNRAIAKLDAQGIQDPEIRRQILQDIRRHLNEGHAGAAPWQKDAILRPEGLDSDIRVVLEGSIIKECFETAFTPALQAIRRALGNTDSPRKKTLLLLYGGSTYHEFLRNKIADVARKDARVTTELVGVHNDGEHSEKIDRGSASYRTKKYREAHPAQGPGDGAGRKRGRPIGLPVQCTVRLASSWIGQDYKSAISTGAPLAVLHKLTLEEFLRRGATIGINIHPRSGVETVLRQFDQGGDVIRASLQGLAIPDALTDTNIDDAAPPGLVSGSDSGSEEEMLEMVKRRDVRGQRHVIRRKKTWKWVPREKAEYRVMLVCAPMGTGRRGMIAEQTYQLFHFKGIKPGFYDVDMVCDVSTSKLTVTYSPRGKDDTIQKKWEFDLYFDIGSICVMVENPVMVETLVEVKDPKGKTAPAQFTEAAPPTQPTEATDSVQSTETAASDARPVPEHPPGTETTNGKNVDRESSLTAGYPSPTMSAHGLADGITCSIPETSYNGRQGSRVGISFLCN